MFYQPSYFKREAIVEADDIMRVYLFRYTGVSLGYTGDGSLKLHQKLGGIFGRAVVDDVVLIPVALEMRFDGKTEEVSRGRKEVYLA